ncbi:transcription termination factor 2, mitochondrial isoform X1 [Brienomyrus brachyistius]|uniref:transcription termination factor 2, mitochondrial isoform X1 n=2 Tax=Brienomyrus brachyistius TaxID=42636 RepID=UPI0020B191DE|nr:transcription termination factor 2, mitochondrial isoform X1 [Brienomyrus brachyistius]XP_048837832.1 transcription termination factor 2, mitochondrial isoform X1 [Brienomyrus brachyistius]XP_048837922.1 transcription termination factor 2, mitochondrial isoform X1 [Brienomyrus brachyistius]
MKRFPVARWRSEYFSFCNSGIETDCPVVETMLRWTTTSFCTYWLHIRPFFLPRTHCSTLSSSQVENKFTVDRLSHLSVDIGKIRKLKGWVLFQSPTYVNETARLLRDLGANKETIGRILEQHPEAVLCTPEELQAQHELWTTVCPNSKDLLGIIEKFPASFFTVSHYANQKANIQFFQSLHLNKRIISKLMGSAPQSFSRPVEKNQEMIHTLKESYLRLGGSESNMKIWLQKLLSQNPFILIKPPEVVWENIQFLQDRGFSAVELLHLVSKLKGFITELSPKSMQNILTYSLETLQCSETELRVIILKCPGLLNYPVPVLDDRLKGLFEAGISLDQIKDTPTILELTTQIVLYRIQKLESYGYSIKTGSLEALDGTKKDFEMMYGRLKLRQERPIFNPVAPLRSTEE